MHQSRSTPFAIEISTGMLCCSLSDYGVTIIVCTDLVFQFPSAKKIEHFGARERTSSSMGQPVILDNRFKLFKQFWRPAGNVIIVESKIPLHEVARKTRWFCRPTPGRGAASGSGHGVATAAAPPFIAD
jgi:hypothetical protein